MHIHRLFLALGIIASTLYSNTYANEPHSIAQEYASLMATDNVGGKRRALKNPLFQALASIVDKIQASDAVSNATTWASIKNSILLHVNPGYFIIDDSLLWLSPERAPKLNELVNSLAHKMAIKPPVIFTPINKKLHNALSVAFGKDASEIIIDEVVVCNLSLAELTAVLAHELAHVKHDRSIKTLRITAFTHMLLPLLISGLYIHYTNGIGKTCSSTLSFIKHLIILTTIQASVTYIIEYFLNKHVMQQFEYEADATAALVTHDDQALTSALNSLQRHAQLNTPDEIEFLQEQIALIEKQHPTIARTLTIIIETACKQVTENSTHPSNEDRADAIKLLLSKETCSANLV